jgi:3-oxoacyl-[acyl-carrier protein] reductase
LPEGEEEQRGQAIVSRGDRFIILRTARRNFWRDTKRESAHFMQSEQLSVSHLSLAGRTAVVTGAGSGIGRAIAAELAAAGAHCFLHTGSNRAGLDETIAAVRAANVQAAGEVADLSSFEAQDRLVEQACNWHGGVDIWINNAGVDVLTGERAGWSFEQKLAALWEVDVIATARLSRAVGKRMLARGQGAIVNIGWDQAEQGMAGDSGELFAMIKGAVMAFTRSLAQSLAPAVRVNCVAPGWIRTAWGQDASPAWQARARREALLDRWGAPADIARAVVFLASPAADFINGQIVPVNGGFRYSQAVQGADGG